MGRRRFTREFKLEAVKLIKDRGVSCVQAARDLGVHQSVLRNWVKGSRSAAFLSWPRSQTIVAPDREAFAVRLLSLA
jgi:transposase